VGAFSSILIASPVVVLLKEREPRNRQIRARLASQRGPVEDPLDGDADADLVGAAPTPRPDPADAPTPSGRPIPPRPRKQRKRR
jgi:hypothetical protein